jgi:hypothetical protein
MKKATAPADGSLPTHIGAPAHRALTGAGYTRLELLAKVSKEDLLQLHGVGPKAIRLLDAALRARGLKFKPAPKKTKRARK